MARNRNDTKNIFKVREIVFIKEQKVPISEEVDGLDKNAKHIIASYKSKPIGCAIIRFIGKKAKLERIALLKNYRGKGFGKNIVKHLIQYCKNKNIKEWLRCICELIV